MLWGADFRAHGALLAEGNAFFFVRHVVCKDVQLVVVGGANVADDVGVELWDAVCLLAVGVFHVKKLGPPYVQYHGRFFLTSPKKSPPSQFTTTLILFDLSLAALLYPNRCNYPFIMSSSLKSSTVAAITAGTVVTGLLAYAIYFDHRRRTDPEFRRALKRESKKQARAAKEEAEAQGAQQKRQIKDAVEKANEDGFPKDPEEVEAYFMQEVARGEGMTQEGMLDHHRRPFSVEHGLILLL